MGNQRPSRRSWDEVVIGFDQDLSVPLHDFKCLRLDL